jgi:predicted transcriptional regulator
MSKSSEAVKKWRENTKIRIVDSMGGKCAICGYNKCIEALDLHHLNPSDKDFSLGGIRSNPSSWVKIVAELQKCILLCSNCHREVHCGAIEIQNNFSDFNVDFLDYKKTFKDLTTSTCPICGKPKPESNITCSKKCAAQKTSKVNWESIDVVSLINEGKTKTEIGEQLEVSAAAVFKRIKNHHPELMSKMKRFSKNNKTCSVCGSKIKQCSKSGLCSICYNLKTQHIERPTKEMLQEKITTSSWNELAKKIWNCRKGNSKMENKL